MIATVKLLPVSRRLLIVAGIGPYTTIVLIQHSTLFLIKLTIMKKIFFMGFTAILLAGSACNIALSQNLNNSTNSDLPIGSENDSFSMQLNSIKKSDALRLNEVSSKAVRHFKQTYKNADSVKWSKLTDGKGGFGASFVSDGISTIVRYDLGGNYDCSFREYYEDNLPKQVRHQVKSVYYDFTIRFIKEVNMYDNTVYLITLEDKASWKHILVTEHKIVVLKEFSKTSKSSSGN